MDRKFNVIRIPIKYTKQIDILTEKQQLYIYKSLGALGRGEDIQQKESMEFYILCNIFEEWMSMESKNGNKSEKSLTKYLSELPAQVEPSDSEAIVQDSIVQDSIVKENTLQESKDFISENLPKQNLSALILDTFIKLGYIPTESIDEFRDWVKTRIYDVYDFKYNEIENVTMKFYDYWIQETIQKRKNKNWKATFNNSFDLKSLKLK